MTAEARPPVDPGPRPDLRWIPVDACTIDRRYQRTLESRRSQSLIQAIAAGFKWASFQSVLVTPTSSGKAWLIIDGQHRIEAARLCGIPEVPAVVVEAATLEEQAAAFVTANMGRVAVNQFALHHARVAAGDPEALAANALCKASGIVIPRFPTTARDLKPLETLALGTIVKLPKMCGDGIALAAMRAVANAFPEEPATISAAMIKAVAVVIQNAPADLRIKTAERVEAFLAGKKASDHRAMAARVMTRQAGTEITALAHIISTALQREAAAAAQPQSSIAPVSREQLMGRR